MSPPADARAHVMLVLHMHQPPYTDPDTGRAALPWARLHATREYNDVAGILARHPGIRVTVNWVPTLLAQIEAYLRRADFADGDDFIALSRRDPATMSEAERVFLTRNFFLANVAHMIEPYPRFAELLALRGRERDETRLIEAARAYTRQDLVDLQTWFNLTWLGFQAERDFPRVAALKAQGRDFTPAQRDEVLAIQREVMAGLLGAWRTLADRGQVELTTTPYHHPILPLLIDNAIARRAEPGTALPELPFAWPEDAQEQLRRAKPLFARIFGREPVGLWPSEGSVCPELIPLVRQAGFHWLATDEEVLARSLPTFHRDRDVYRFHRVIGPESSPESGPERASEEVGPFMIFRDRELSDLIGFTYAKWPAHRAAADLVARLDAIARRRSDAQIALVFDGENPWETYPGGGEAFLGELFSALTDHPRLVTRTVAESLVQRPPPADAAPIDRLHSGSWINGNFHIWIGAEDDRRAWTEISRVRTALDAAPADHPGREAAYEAILAAQASDWFWWYGDDFHTETLDIFDRLFRAHVSAAWRHLGLPPPHSLSRPIPHAGQAAPAVGRATAWPHTGAPPGWGAGRIRLAEPGSAMYAHAKVPWPTFLDYQFGGGFLRLELPLTRETFVALAGPGSFLRFSFGDGALPAGARFPRRIDVFSAADTVRVSFPADTGSCLAPWRLPGGGGAATAGTAPPRSVAWTTMPAPWLCVGTAAEVAASSGMEASWGSRLHLRIPFDDGWMPGGVLGLEIIAVGAPSHTVGGSASSADGDGEELERRPSLGRYDLPVPGLHERRRLWSAW